MRNRTTRMGLKFNKFKKWGSTKDSFFIVKGKSGSTPPPPPGAGFILQENGAKILSEGGGRLITEF